MRRGVPQWFLFKLRGEHLRYMQFRLYIFLEREYVRRLQLGRYLQCDDKHL